MRGYAHLALLSEDVRWQLKGFGKRKQKELGVFLSEFVDNRSIGLNLLDRNREKKQLRKHASDAEAVFGVSPDRKLKSKSSAKSSRLGGHRNTRLMLIRLICYVGKVTMMLGRCLCQRT